MINELKQTEKVTQALVKRIPFRLEILETKRISKTKNPAETFEQVAQIRTWADQSIKALRKEAKDILAGAKDTVRRVEAKVRKVCKEEFEPYLIRSDALLRDYADDLKAVEQKNAEQRAKRLEKKGDTGRAEDVRTEAAIAKVHVESAFVQTREVWSAKVEDLPTWLEAAQKLITVDANLRAKLIELVEAYYRASAIAAKHTDLGIPGVVGVVSTKFGKKRDA